MGEVVESLISYIQYNCLLRALFAPEGTQHDTYTSILTCAPMYIYLFALRSTLWPPLTMVVLRCCSPPSTMSTNSQATAGVWRQSRQVEVRLRTPAPVRSDERFARGASRVVAAALHRITDDPFLPLNVFPVPSPSSLSSSPLST